jgi:hypothetical protein
MKGIIIGIILMNISFFALSQKGIIVKGIVIGQEGNPISNANVLIIGTSNGTKTNDEGYFYLKSTSQSSTLKISHIGYFSRNKILTNEIVNDTIKVKIQLTEKVNQLANFEISTEKIDLIYNKPFVPIYDYQFNENKLLLLVKEFKHIKIKLTDLDQKEINELTVPENTKQIYLDCFGNVHLLNNDSAYQLEIDENKIRIVYRVSINKFNLFLKPCITEFNNNFIFKESASNSQSITYYCLDENKEIKYLKKIEDKVAERYIKQRNQMIKQLQNPSFSQMSEGKISLHTTRSLMQNIAFLGILLNHLTDNPLFAIKNKVYIFDHTTDSCLIFNENLVIERSFFTDYKFKKKWDKELIVDKEEGEIYAKFKKDGLCYLKKIDLTTGKIIKSYMLEKHTYPTNIKIRNNTAYYLYKDHYNHGQMSLFKQGLY